MIKVIIDDQRTKDDDTGVFVGDYFLVDGHLFKALAVSPGLLALFSLSHGTRWTDETFVSGMSVKNVRKRMFNQKSMIEHFSSDSITLTATIE